MLNFEGVNKYSHHGQFQASKVKSLNMELGREMHQAPAHHLRVESEPQREAWEAAFHPQAILVDNNISEPLHPEISWGLSGPYIASF